MPKVVIELQANTQDAVQKIQQFAKAQKDAFDAVKAGNPALQDASVKVSKLSENTSNAAKATDEFGRAAKGLAQGGIRELAGGIPVVGDALANLAGTLRGFPAIMLGVVGAGAAFIAYLKSVEAQADKTAASIAKMSGGIQASFMVTNTKIGAVRAGAAGDLGGQKALDFKAFEQETNNARGQALADAQKEREGAITTTDRAMGLLNPQALLDKQALAETAYQTKRRQINQEADDAIRLAREKLAADLGTIEGDLDTKLAAGQEKRGKDAADAAEKQSQLVGRVKATLEGLGAGFEDATKSLGLTQFVEATTKQIADLNAGIEAGIDTHGRFAEAVKVLQEKMAEAVRLGYVPVTEAAAAAVPVLEDAGGAALKAGQDFAAAAQAMAQAQAAMGAARNAARASQDNSPHTGTFTIGDPQAGTGPVLDSLQDLHTRYQIEKTFSEAGVRSFQHGGTVPGVGPVPIVAHGGERIVPAHAAGGRGGAVRIEAGAIQISGTVIDQQRDWDGLVVSLGQALAAKLR